MVKCEVCGEIFKAITHKHLKKHDMTVGEYLKKFNLVQAQLTSRETSSKLSNSLKGKKVGDANPAKRPEVRKAISSSLKKAWTQGLYDYRINAMIGLMGKEHHGYKPEVHTPTYLGEKEFKQFLSIFQPVDRCTRCGRSGRTINVHHIDEDHQNFLISNLEPLCVPCHMTFHYASRKQPFISIVKEFSFASAHFLPNYDGKCANLHGHEWRVEIEIRKRIDPDSGMVIDFSTLKKIVNEGIVDILDHQLLNDYIENPTAENLLVMIWEVLMFNSLLKGISRIQIWESRDSYAFITTKDMLSIFKENIEDYMSQY